MISHLDEALFALSYLALSIVSFNCLSIYVKYVGSEARSFGYGIFIVNAVYGLGGALSSITNSLSHVQVVFYITEVSFALPLLATEMWIQNNIFPKQEELIYLPCILGLLPFFSFILMGTIRIDLIELCLVYCCVCTSYVGCNTKDYTVVSACLLFYLGYNFHHRDKVKISNILFILFIVCALESVCPNCIEEWGKRNNYEEKRH